MRRIAASCAAVCLVTGPAVSAQSAVQAPASDSVGYHLTRTVLALDVTWTLSCDPGPGQAPGLYDASVDIDAQVTPRFEADPGAFRMLKLPGLGEALKDADLRVAYYESGTLKAVNGSVVDRTFDVVSNLVVGTGRLVLAAVGTLARGTLPMPAPPRCSQGAARATVEMGVARESLRTTLKKIQDVRWALPGYKATSADYDKAMKDLAELGIEQAAAERRIAGLKAGLQATASCIIVPSETSPSARCLPPDSVKGWFDGSDPALAVSLDTLVRGGWDHKPQMPTDAIVYRAPRLATIEITADGSRLGSGSVLVAQAGPEASLPFVDNRGRLLNAELTFSPSGVPTTTHYSTASRAAKWAETYARSSETLAKFVELSRGAPAADLAREIEWLKLQVQKAEAETALLKARKALDQSK